MEKPTEKEVAELTEILNTLVLNSERKKMLSKFELKTVSDIQNFLEIFNSVNAILTEKEITKLFHIRKKLKFMEQLSKSEAEILRKYNLTSSNDIKYLINSQYGNINSKKSIIVLVKRFNIRDISFKINNFNDIIKLLELVSNENERYYIYKEENQYIFQYSRD
jgi:hypothetical protein